MRHKQSPQGPIRLGHADVDANSATNNNNNNNNNKQLKLYWWPPLSQELNHQHQNKHLIMTLDIAIMKADFSAPPLQMSSARYLKGIV